MDTGDPIACPHAGAASTLPSEFAFVFCFWILIVAVGMLLASSFGMTRTHCGTEDRGGPSVAANNKHLKSVLMPCPFKVLTHGIPKMACGPLEEANGLGCPQPSCSNRHLMRDHGLATNGSGASACLCTAQLSPCQVMDRPSPAVAHVFPHTLRAPS